MNHMEQRQDRREQAVKHFLREYLGKAKDAQTMNCILQDIGRYYDADRAYIFEAHMGRRVFNNRRPLKTTFCGFEREILAQQKFWKSRNTWCIAGFSKRIVGAKDPLKTQKGSF